MSEDFIGLLLLAGLVIWLMYGRRGRREPPVANQIARIEGLLVDLNARLQALEQWATQAPGTQFPPMLPTTTPPDAAATTVSPSQGPPSLPLGPSSSPLTSSTVPVGAQLTAGVASSAAVPAPIATGATESPSTAIPVATAETSPASATASTPPRRPPWSFADLEQLLSGRGLAWLGGLAILIGALFFLGLAFTRGWIGPGTRVTIGLIAGGLLAAGGAWFFERREALFGHVLVAVGLGTISIALVAATRLYGLLPAPVGLLGALITAGAATIIAIRADS
ncbi:MAG TPA: DUF2339 domain-containing protein, partial [Herpetosiphonaceae bacterium]|nr:DUF2339 domain-containing protein [Herpetosiphonaceae bacterium]